MEGFCRGCLIKYDEPMELLQYNEKNRRLFVYSTGLQVKRNDAFTFQLCKDCFLNMKQACKFKKNCRTSDKRFRNYLALKDVGEPVDFCTFLKNSDDTLTFRLPMASGSSTPATHKEKDDDNESTCTSIRNFMTDILQGEEMPDTEARIIKEVIEEEADVLDDSLDSHWLQDDMSIDTDFRLDLSFSPFSTPRTVNNDPCYTPQQKEDQVTFNTINTEKQTKVLKDFTNAFKTDDTIEELSMFVGAVEKTESFNNLKQLSPFGIDEIDGMENPETDSLKNKPNLKEYISNLVMDEIDGMDTSDSKTDNSNEKLIELCDFGIEENDSSHKKESNNLESDQNVNELCNFGLDENDLTLKNNKSLKELISNMDLEEIEGVGDTPVNNHKSLKELISNMDTDKIDAYGKSELQSSKKEFCDFSLDSFSGVEKAEINTLKTVQSHKELCDFSLDSIGSIEKPASITNKTDQSLKELLDLSLNSFDDSAKSGSNAFKNAQTEKELDLSLNDLDDITNSGSNTFKTGRNIQEICDFGVDEMNGNEKSESNLDLPSLSDVFERDKMDTPDFDLPKGVRSVHSQNDISNSSINIEALLKDKLRTIDKKSEDALKNTDSQEFSLDYLLVSPTVYQTTSAASTPTITNILFGEKLDTPNTNTRIDQYHDVEIFEEFFQNDIKEFDLEDIKRVNGGFTSEEWTTPIAVKDTAIDNKEYKSKNIDMDVSIAIKDQTDDNYNTALTKSKNDIVEYISDTTPNDKFDMNNSYCKLCEIKYNTTKALSIHLSKYHKIKIVKPRIRNGNNYDTTGTEPENEEIVDISGMPPNDNFDIKNLYCNLCKIKYDNLTEFSIHVSKTHLVKNVKLNEALLDTSDTSFNDKFDLENLYCKLCDKKYGTSRALSVHFSKTHNIKIVKPKFNENQNYNKIKIAVTEYTSNDKFDIKKSYCKLCKKLFKNGRALSIHFSITHNIKIVKPAYDRKKNQKAYSICNYCGKKCEDSTNFARHVKLCKLKELKKTSNKCDYCHQEFKTQFNLEKHMASHTKMKRKKATGEEIICTICGVKLHWKHNLALHMRKHSKDYSVKCEYCDKGFYRQSDLNAHVRQHTGETPFSCTFCTRLFARRDVLLRHIRIHLNERLFECDYCGLKCMQKFDLINHIQNKSCRKDLKKKSVKKENMDFDIPEEKENVKLRKIKVRKEVEVRKDKADVRKGEAEVGKEDVEVEVRKEEVTVIYAKGSDATLKHQLPFLETERKVQTRQKWRQQVKQLQLGEMVLDKDDRLPPTRWLLGRVVRVNPRGSDGVTRVSDVLTNSGTLRRAFNRLPTASRGPELRSWGGKMLTPIMCAFFNGSRTHVCDTDHICRERRCGVTRPQIVETAMHTY